MLRLLLLTCVLAVSARQICLSGTASLSLGATAPTRSWCDNSDCTLHFELSFDTEDSGSSRWALNATIHEGVKITSIFPQLVDLSIQCSTSGDIIMTTSSGPNNERLRFIWTYAGVSSFSCPYMFSSIDLQSDFRNFAALFSYSGHISSYDATFTSTSPVFSLASLEEVCVTDDTMEEEPNTPAPSPSRVPSASKDPTTCTIGACRHSAAKWRSLANDPAWHVIQEQTLCGLSYHDIIFSSGDARYMPIHWMELAQPYVAAALNAALYGCNLPLETMESLRQADAFLQNRLKCSMNTDHSDWAEPIADWNDQFVACQQLIDDSGNMKNGGEIKKDVLSTKERTYLIVMIVFIVGFSVLLVILVIVVVFYGQSLRGRLFSRSSGAVDAFSNPIGKERSFGSFFAKLIANEDDGDDCPADIDRQINQPEPPPSYHSTKPVSFTIVNAAASSGHYDSGIPKLPNPQTVHL